MKTHTISDTETMINYIFMNKYKIKKTLPVHNPQIHIQHSAQLSAVHTKTTITWTQKKNWLKEEKNRWKQILISIRRSWAKHESEKVKNVQKRHQTHSIRFRKICVAHKNFFFLLFSYFVSIFFFDFFFINYFVMFLGRDFTAHNPISSISLICLDCLFRSRSWCCACFCFCFVHIFL